MQQQYSLRWNNYFRYLTYALDSHRTNDDFVDVSLICDGRTIKAHKVVLSSCSAYFKEIFKEVNHPHPVIVFKYFKFEDLKSIIEFMYQGEVNVQQEALQSFLQTAEMLAVQGLTAEEKEKPKPPMAAEQKLKAMPSTTVRTINETATATATQTIEIPATLLQPTQQQSQQQQQQHHVQTQLQQIQVQQQPITQQQLQQAAATTTHLQQQLQQQQQQQQLTTNAITLPTTNSMKKRKITFSDEDDSIYTTETVDYAKDDGTAIVKTDMAFLRSEYIVSDVEDPEQLQDDSGAHQSTQDDGTAGNAQCSTTYTSEYEILTESEMEDKYNQADGDNTEITIEMGRLITTNTNATTSTTQATLNEASSGGTGGGGVGTITLKTDNKSSGTSDLPNNKWTECQFCKMVITTVNLWRHIRTQHTPQPPRKCELCNKNFKNKYSLREHIRISHEQKITVKSEN